ncbi:MAG: hypothetical protein RI927_373 [Actinomycetota bacterium]
MRLGFDFRSLRRLTRLNLGLMLYGFGLALIVEAQIGLPPWDVFAKGISIQLGTTYGVASVIVSALVLLAWIPLKVKPGIGSILNAILIGLWSDVFIPMIPKVENYFSDLGQFLFGMVIVATATGLYITSYLGSGPRDGLMIGTQKLLGWPLWQIRTMYEVLVLALGWLMGGQVREGTLIFAVCIGILMQVSLRLFKYDEKKKIQ